MYPQILPLKLLFLLCGEVFGLLTCSDNFGAWFVLAACFLVVTAWGAYPLLKDGQVRLFIAYSPFTTIVLSSSLSL